uniref:hypothetical protein n=1 Tax=uncultured Altererythrobacter sp. TaxID=500840 RepID=UPI002607C9F7|nr:hypothetical protein [uncultured Altererythrobacter sp.]
MTTRYKSLRSSIELLAAPAATQSAWLDWVFSDLTHGQSAEVYGNYELIENCYDIIGA